VMLDTRGLRDQQVANDNLAALVDPNRTLLGAAQEAWTFDQLRASQRAGTAWRVLGQQIMFSRVMPPGRPVLLTDTWEGYQAARARVLDFIAAEKISDVAILAGDIHSSWAFDVPPNPFGGYTAANGSGSLAVEIVAPAISSPPLFTDPLIRARAPVLQASLPHLKYLEGASNGYVLLDHTGVALESLTAPPSVPVIEVDGVSLPWVRLGDLLTMKENLGLWAAVLLLVGGLMLVIPQLYGNLMELTGGMPWLQMLVGALSVVVALVLFASGKNEI